MINASHRHVAVCNILNLTETQSRCCTIDCINGRCDDISCSGIVNQPLNNSYCCDGNDKLCKFRCGVCSTFDITCSVVIGISTTMIGQTKCDLNDYQCASDYQVGKSLSSWYDDREINKIKFDEQPSSNRDAHRAFIAFCVLTGLSLVLLYLRNILCRAQYSSEYNTAALAFALKLKKNNLINDILKEKNIKLNSECVRHAINSKMLERIEHCDSFNEVIESQHLYRAISDANPKYVKILLEHGVKFGSHTSRFSARKVRDTLKDDIQIIELLLQYGYDYDSIPEVYRVHLWKNNMITFILASNPRLADCKFFQHDLSEYRLLVYIKEFLGGVNGDGLVNTTADNTRRAARSNKGGNLINNHVGIYIDIHGGNRNIAINNYRSLDSSGYIRDLR